MYLYVSYGVFTCLEKTRLMALRNFINRMADAVSNTPDLQRNNKP